MMPKTKNIKQQLKYIIKQGYTDDGCIDLYNRLKSYTEYFNYNTSSETIFHLPDRSMNMTISWNGTSSNITAFIGRINKECRIISFEYDNTIVIGKANSKENLKIYNCDSSPTYDDLRNINIDEEIYQYLIVFRILVTPMIDHILKQHITKLGQN